MDSALVSEWINLLVAVSLLFWGVGGAQIALPAVSPMIISLVGMVILYIMSGSRYLFYLS